MTTHHASGSFVLQHCGLMTRGAPPLTVTVVPDSASGGLARLAGSPVIRIADGRHSYALDSTL